MINKFKDKLKGKDAKVLLENFISLSALQLFGMILPLITLPYVLRTIGFENYGTIVFAASLIAYFSALTDFSFKYTATRDVAVFRDSPHKLNIIYSKVVIIKAFFLIISFVSIGLIVFFYKPFYENRLIYLLTTPMLLGQAVFPDWFFQGIEKMKYITILNLGIKIFFTICIFIFIKEKSDFWIYPLLQSAGFLGAGIVGQVILFRKYKVRFLYIRRKVIFKTIKSNTPIFINQFLPTLYNNTSTFLLGILTNNAFVGVYEAIKVVVNLCITGIEILSRVFFPYLNRRRNSFNKYKNLMLIITAILIVLCLSSYKLVFWYLNIHDPIALPVLIVLTLGLLGYSLYNIFGVNFFIILRQDKLVMYNTIIASCFSLVFAFPLIYYMGILGAAINLTICRLLMGGILFYKWKQHVKKEFRSEIV